MQLKVLGNRVLVLPKDTVNETKTGLILINSEHEKQLEGVVVCVGPGRLDNNGNRIKMHVKTGDIVLFTKSSGEEIELDKQRFLLIREDSILAKVREV